MDPAPMAGRCHGGPGWGAPHTTSSPRENFTTTNPGNPFLCNGSESSWQKKSQKPNLTGELLKGGPDVSAYSCGGAVRPECSAAVWNPTAPMGAKREAWGCIRG